MNHKVARILEIIDSVSESPREWWDHKDDIEEEITKLLDFDLRIEVGEIWGVMYHNTYFEAKCIGVDYDAQKAVFKNSIHGIRTLSFCEVKRTCAFIRKKNNCIFFNV